MGEILKVLGQSTPTATTLTNLYTVPSTYAAVISSITICNSNASTVLFRISIAQAGSADDLQQYIYYDLPLAPNDTFIATIGISLAETDVIRIQSDTANVSFNLLGVEIIPGAIPAPPINAAGGDLDGYYPNPGVAAVNGVAVTGVPSNGQVLTATGSAAADWQAPAMTPIILPITFQPGGTAESNVFTTESTLNTALAGAFGPQTVYVDLNANSGAYTTGAAITFGTYLIGVPFYSNGSTPVLTLATAATLTGDTVEIDDIRLVQNNGPNFSTEPLLVRARGNALLYSGDGTTLYQVTTTSTLEVYDGAIIGTGTEAVINVQSGGTLNVFLYGAPTLSYGPFFGIGAGAITVAGGGTLNINLMSPGATIDPSYLTLSGTTVTYNFTRPAAIFETTIASSPENITSARTFNPSPTTTPGSFKGIVNLGSDTTNATTGASANFITIAGGDQNSVGADYSFIGGGLNNAIAISTSSLSWGCVINGGTGNTIDTLSQGATIGGGYTNAIDFSSGYTTIAGGQGNVIGSTTASGWGTIGGGNSNSVNGNWGTISGGQTNAIVNQYDVIGGGLNNTSSTGGGGNTIGGGNGNIVGSSAGGDSVGGGALNAANGGVSTVAGGSSNTISTNSTNAFIGSGNSNSINNGSTYSVISGGNTNQLYNWSSCTISGGEFHFMNGTHATIGGGYGNSVQAFGHYSTITGGYTNNIYGQYGTIGGFNNTAHGDYVTMFGSNNTDTASPGGYATAFGNDNTVSGEASTAIGSLHTASGENSFAAGFNTHALRNGQFSFSSSAGNVAGTNGDAQNGNMVYSGGTQTLGAGFSVVDSGGFTPGGQEFALETAKYYNITINMILTANNAAVGPVYASYNVMAHVALGVAIIDNQQQTITTTTLATPNLTGVQDPYTTGWLTSVTVDGTTNKLHINVDPNGDSTNTINACADIRWVEVLGFSQ